MYHDCGQISTWMGVRKQLRRGEASSQLRFDYLQLVKKAEAE